MRVGLLVAINQSIVPHRKSFYNRQPHLPQRALFQFTVARKAFRWTSAGRSGEPGAPAETPEELRNKSGDAHQLTLQS